jgi:hypothetical protein
MDKIIRKHYHTVKNTDNLFDPDAFEVGGFRFPLYRKLLCSTCYSDAISYHLDSLHAVVEHYGEEDDGAELDDQ